MRFPGGDRPSASKFGYADMEVWPLRVQPTRSDVSDVEVVKNVEKNNVEYNIFIWFVKVCKMFIFMIYFFKIIFLRMISVYLFMYGNQNVCRFEVRVFVKPSILPSDIQSDMSTWSEEGVTMHHIIHTSSFGNHMVELSSEYSCILNLFCWLILDWQETTKPWGVKASLMLDRLDMTEIVATRLTRPHHSLTFTHWNRQKFVLSQILIIDSTRRFYIFPCFPTQIFILTLSALSHFGLLELTHRTWDQKRALGSFCQFGTLWLCRDSFLYRIIGMTSPSMSKKIQATLQTMVKM